MGYNCFGESLNVVLGALSAVHFDVVVKLQSGSGDRQEAHPWGINVRLMQSLN